MTLIPITERTRYCIVDCGKEICECKPSNRIEMDKKKTLDDMKEEYARENNFCEWSEILYSTDDPAEIDDHFDKVARLFATEACKESLRLASENARIEEHDVDYKNINLVDFGRYSFRGDESPVEVRINKQSILSESNIPLDVIK